MADFTGLDAYRTWLMARKRSAIQWESTDVQPAYPHAWMARLGEHRRAASVPTCVYCTNVRLVSTGRIRCTSKSCETGGAAPDSEEPGGGGACSSSPFFPHLPANLRPTCSLKTLNLFAAYQQFNPPHLPIQKHTPSWSHPQLEKRAKANAFASFGDAGGKRPNNNAFWTSPWPQKGHKRAPEPNVMPGSNPR